jgi:hypothetical protein
MKKLVIFIILCIIFACKEPDYIELGTIIYAGKLDNGIIITTVKDNRVFITNELSDELIISIVGEQLFYMRKGNWISWESSEFALHPESIKIK